MPNLSVIVPVYNSEKFLKKCLDSLIDLRDTEIIVINDGSTDKSEQIINEYSSKYENIFYYKKENTGIADTRNFGIEHATGEYIFFVDSDDYIDAGQIDLLFSYMKEKIDVIKFKLQRVDENGNITEKIDGAVFDKINGEKAFELLYPTDVLLDSPCVYLFRREYLKQNGFKFQVGTYHEDFGLIPLIVIKADSVISRNMYIYNYVQSSNSITRNEDYKKTIRKMEDSLKQYDRMLEQIEGLSKKAQENIKIYYTNAIILKLDELKESEQDRFINEIKKRRMIKNIKIRDLKQLLKRILLSISIKTYLKKR